MIQGRNIRRVFFLLTAAAFLFFCLSAYADTPEDDTIPVPLYIDDVYSGEIPVIILPDESVQIRPSDLIMYLEELMSKESIDTAKMIFPESGWLDLTETAGLGVRILFKFEDLTIHITIPAHLRRETVISFKSRQKEPEGEYIEKTDFSAFLNLKFWNRYTYETFNYDYSVEPEIGLNIFDWVAEADGGVRSGSELFFLDYARLVRDFPSIGYRLEAGDLTMPVTDITGVSALTGVSFRKNGALQPRSTAPSPYIKEIFIREPTKVEIYMNDRKIREKDYQSGNYIFADFPFVRGVNRISIKWEDSDGEHEEKMVVPFEGNLLAPGEYDLGAAAGLPDRAITLPAVSSYQYLGITDKFTFGITESFNIDTLELCIHPDFLLSTTFGNFNLVPVWGINFNGGQRVNAGLGYQMLKPGNTGYLNFGLNLNYTLNSITYPETPLSLLSADGYYNFVFGEGFSFTPDLFWGWRFDESRQIITAKATLKKSIRGGSSLSANIGFKYDNEPEFSATISYSSSFPEVNQNLYLLENLDKQRLSAFWTRYSTEENDLSLNASAEVPINLDDKLSMGMSAAYRHPIFRIDAGHDFYSVIESAEIHNSTYLSGESGLAYAGGHLLATKPVKDSFIIIVPGPEFSDQTIKINPRTGGSDLELKGKSGIMPEIGSFRTYRVYIEPEELPEGMDDSGMKYLAVPSYKSAFVVTPEAEIRIFAGGIITDNEGEPVSIVLGNLTGKNTSESIDFFTDDNGYFEAYNLPQDVYSIRLNGYEHTATMDLTETEGGFYDAGTITLPEE